MLGLTVDQEKRLAVSELPMPSYGPCQALVHMRSCGVCNGTDSKLIHGTFKNFDTYPAVLGHEGVGEVVEIGAQVQNLRVGNRVLLPFLEGMSGDYHSGWGAYAQYAVVGDAQAYIAQGMGPGTPQFSEAYFAQTVLRPHDRVDDVGAAMIITFREVLSAMRRFGFAPNTNLVVFGAGPVGMCFVKFAKLLGMGTVICVDITEEKVQAALSMGADAALNSRACDTQSDIRSLLPQGADYVVDAVGLSSLINQAMGLIADHGKICCYGISPNLEMNLNWRDAPYNWSLDFVQWPSKLEEAQAHAQVMAWINMGVLNPHDFISDIIPFENILEAFRIVEERRAGTKKIVIQFK